MDSYKPTNVVFTRIKCLDPDNASKIMGYILIQDPGDDEMVRLAFAQDIVLQNVINQAKTYLGLSSNTSSAPPSPTPFNPITKHNTTTTNNNPLSLSSSSPRILNNGFNLKNPSSPSSSPWFGSDLRSRPNTNNGNNNPISPISIPQSLSYAAVVNGGNINNASNNSVNEESLSLTSPVSSFYNNGGDNNVGDLLDEYQLQDHLSFLNESKGDDLFDPRLELSMNGNHNSFHRRSVSLNDACYGGGGCEDGSSGFGWRPCMYFARGFCKNGSTCKFVHGDFSDSSDVSAIVGSPSKLDVFEQSQEILRSRAAQQQRMAVASQLMAGASFPYNKCMNLFNDNHRSAAAAALMMGDDFHKFGRCRSERNDFTGMGLGGMNPGSRQIYLTFPADSTFREEDVSNYFSIYGPVQDVRIPYQQKRMFGFVTFIYPETVKIILAKGNPHFVCDSRVLVKPYKEKGKVEKKQHQQQPQQFERGELSPREPYDIQIGPRMFYNAQEMMLRRKLEEQADLQQAIELQGRRMMNLQLLDIKNHHHHQYQHNLSPVDHFPMRINQNLILPSDSTNQDVSEEDSSAPDAATSPNTSTDQQVQREANAEGVGSSVHENGNGKEDIFSDFEFNESLKHILPDSLFASPTKSAGDHNSVFGSAPLPEADDNECIATSSTTSNTTTLLASTSILNMAPAHKSCFFEKPRFSSGHEAIEM